MNIYYISNKLYFKSSNKSNIYTISHSSSINIHKQHIPSNSAQYQRQCARNLADSIIESHLCKSSPPTNASYTRLLHSIFMHESETQWAIRHARSSPVKAAPPRNYIAPSRRRGDTHRSRKIGGRKTLPSPGGGVVRVKRK